MPGKTKKYKIVFVKTDADAELSNDQLDSLSDDGFEVMDFFVRTPDSPAETELGDMVEYGRLCGNSGPCIGSMVQDDDD